MYADFVGLSLKDIELKKLGNEFKTACLNNTPMLNQWETTIEFTRLAKFDCEYFKH
jgi:hypothetical protein